MSVEQAGRDRGIRFNAYGWSGLQILRHGTLGSSARAVAASRGSYDLDEMMTRGRSNAVAA